MVTTTNSSLDSSSFDTQLSTLSYEYVINYYFYIFLLVSSHSTLRLVNPSKIFDRVSILGNLFKKHINLPQVFYNNVTNTWACECEQWVCERELWTCERDSLSNYCHMDGHYYKSCIMRPLNLWLHATIYHLQLCFIIFTTSHHPFKFTTIFVTMVQLLNCTSIHIDQIIRFFIQE